MIPATSSAAALAVSDGTLVYVSAVISNEP